MKREEKGREDGRGGEKTTEEGRRRERRRRERRAGRGEEEPFPTINFAHESPSEVL